MLQEHALLRSSPRIDDVPIQPPASAQVQETLPSREPHWIVKELFSLAQSKGISLQQLERLVISKTGTRIPFQTMKYWRNGKSHPKIDEVDTIAKAMGLELELMDQNAGSN